MRLHCNELLASFKRAREMTHGVGVRRETSTELLRARLDDIDGVAARVEALFPHAAGEPVALVRASDGTPRPHQFGNTGPATRRATCARSTSSTRARSMR